VPVTKTRDELERLLSNHGASQIRIERDMKDGRAAVTFSFPNPQRMVRLDVRVDSSTLPNPKEPPWRQAPGISTPQGWGRLTEKGREDWVRGKIEQLEREAWRRLLLVVKAKLELVAGGDTTIEREFLADILTADGGTVHEHLSKALDSQYLTGSMTPLLPAARGA
jgi:hypothetical protein